MRILAIRGCNLASLAGEFEIDLAHGALASAGVFAIVGPTGAGKSTLLDAMCVALFDRTPRLANRSTVVVGREDDPAALGAQDVRSLLRRGASTGWAEVDFESGDARRYRARWSVRRARGASDGRFQNQQVTLTAIDGGEQLGGTKTETLEAIHQRLGLSFDQFRRSALLAQGEFAAFLRADGKDRSELLERMTGTEIYSQLSIAAHVKAAIAEQQLRERQTAALAIAVLADDERARAEHDLALAKHAQEAARARLAEAEAFARWLAEAERKQRELAAAETARIAAEQASAGATAERAELVLARRAESLRPQWSEVTRLDRQLALAAADATTAADALVQGEAVQREVAGKRAELAELHAPIHEARIAAGLVERRRAGAARANIASQAPLLARARAATADATWLLARRELARAIAAWQSLDRRFAEQATLTSELALADRALDDHARRKKQLVAQRSVTAGEHQQATTRLTEAQREAAAFQQRRGLSLDAARRQEDQARQRCAELERLVALAAQARTAAHARDEIDRQLAEIGDASRLDAERRIAAERDRDAAATLRAERSHLLDELRKAGGYQHARAELVAGDPCPLCGALEHPWRERGSFDALIADAQTRLADAAAQGDAALATLAMLAARDHHRAAERKRLLAAHTTATTTAAATQQTWRDHLAALGELLLVDDPASAAAEQLAAERAEAARAKLEAARTARSQAEAVAKAGADAQARVQARQVDVELHARKLRELDAALAALDAVVERVRGERASTAARHRELLAALDVDLAHWDHPELDAASARVLADARRAIQQGAPNARMAKEQAATKPKPQAPAVLAHAGVDADVLAVRTRAGLGTDMLAVEPRAGVDADVLAAGTRAGIGADMLAAGTRAGLGADVLAVGTRAGLGTDMLAAGTRAGIDADVLAACRRMLTELVRAWISHADVVADVDAALSTARGEIDELAREADRRVTEQRAHRDAAVTRRDALTAELASATAQLDDARIMAGFDRDELRRLLARDPARVEMLAKQLEQLDRAADRARTLVAERRRLVEEHAAARPIAAAFQRDDVAMRPRDDGAMPPRDDVAMRPRDGAMPPHDDIAMRPRDDVAMSQRDNVAVELKRDYMARELERLAAAVAAADHHAAALAATLAADADARVRRARALAELSVAEASAEVDRVLGQVIGSHDGKLFRSFAQSLTLDGLLAVANSHLEELVPRYQLERVPKHDLELQVIDRDLGNDVRSVQSLSGGESFLVSLALALGLSSMSAHDVRVRTLLIDEGFGTLDPSTLDSALAVLDALQATGRQVGIISHVPALVERVRAHVRVSPKGGGRSEVVVAQA